jgi:hypothetical protein
VGRRSHRQLTSGKRQASRLPLRKILSFSPA